MSEAVGGIRDSRGEWQPAERPETAALWAWPPRPLEALHHRYFECNYGNPIVPLDRWFGTFHHGSSEAHARMQERWREKRD